MSVIAIIPDDIEYLCCKCLGTDASLSLMGIDPDNAHEIPALSRLANIIKDYETLRLSNYFPESVKAKLRAPGEEFTLMRSPRGKYQFQRVQYAKHKVECMDMWSNAWKTYNRFDRHSPYHIHEGLYFDTFLFLN